MECEFGKIARGSGEEEEEKEERKHAARYARDESARQVIVDEIGS